jgi:hypothetical protein
MGKFIRMPPWKSIWLSFSLFSFLFIKTKLVWLRDVPAQQEKKLNYLPSNSNTVLNFQIFCLSHETKRLCAFHKSDEFLSSIFQHLSALCLSLGWRRSERIDWNSKVKMSATVFDRVCLGKLSFQAVSNSSLDYLKTKRTETHQTFFSTFFFLFSFIDKFSMKCILVGWIASLWDGSHWEKVYQRSHLPLRPYVQIVLRPYHTLRCVSISAESVLSSAEGGPVKMNELEELLKVLHNWWVSRWSGMKDGIRGIAGSSVGLIKNFISTHVHKKEDEIRPEAHAFKRTTWP